MRTKKVGFTEPSKQGKKCIHKECFSNGRTHPGKSACVGFEGCLRCILCVLWLPAILVNLSIYSDHSPSSCATGCLHFSEKIMNLRPNLLKKYIHSLALSYYQFLCHEPTTDTCTVMQEPGQMTESRHGWQLFWIAVRGMHLSWLLNFSTGFISWEMGEFGLQSMDQFAFGFFDSSWPFLFAILKRDVFLNIYRCLLPFCFWAYLFSNIYWLLCWKW